ncbi:hypothetical protein [Methanocaldococcus sp.]
MEEKILYNRFYNIIAETYKSYLIYGDRSDRKLKLLHEWLGKTIENNIPGEYQVYYMNGKEVQTDGRYYPKVVDIAIVKDNVDNIKIKKVGVKKVYYIPKIEMAISIKFVTSNFRQNANNYIENLIGECANLKSNNVKFAHFVVFRDKTPYFKDGGKLKKWECLTNDHILKYIKLHEDKYKNEFLHVPDAIGLEIVNINPTLEGIYKKKPKFKENLVNTYKINVDNGIENTNLSRDIKEYIKRNLNICRFIDTIANIL